MSREYYISLLLLLKEKNEKKKKIKVISHQDNAPYHKSIVKMVKLHAFHFEFLPRSSYSPDIAPIDYYLSEYLKKKLASERYDSNEEVIAGTEANFKGLDKLFYKKAIEMLERHENEFGKEIVLLC